MQHSLTILRVVLDASAVAVATISALVIRFKLGLFEVTEATEVTVRSHIAPAVAWVLILLISAAGHRLYDEDALVVGSGEIRRVGRAVVEMAGIFAILIFVSQSFQVSRAWFALTLILSLVLLAVERQAFRIFLSSARRRGRWRRPIILLVRDPHTDSSAMTGLDEFEVVHTMTPEGLASYLAEPPRRNGPLPGLLIHDADFDRNEMWRLVMDAGRKGMTSYVLSALRSVRRDRLTVRELSGNTIVKVAPAGLRGSQAILKRAFDLLVGIVLLVIVAPVVAIAALVLRFTSGPPILYRQTRVGAELKPFNIIKLRTMRNDAEPDGPVWSEQQDARVTRVGHWLRRFGVDELPQIYNVVKGDMSLVGPRPERPEFVERFSGEMDWYSYRDRLRPGITGWAQAHGLRGNTSLESRVEFDNWYIENWSLLLDIRILLRTFVEVARGERPDPRVTRG